MPRWSLTKQCSGTRSRKDCGEWESAGGTTVTDQMWGWGLVAEEILSLLHDWEGGSCLLHSGRKGHLPILKDALRIKQLENRREGYREGRREEER